MEVSQHGYDSVYVELKNTTLIFDWLGQEVSKNNTLKRIIPPQFASETEAKVFGALQGALTSSIETDSVAADITVNAIWAIIL